MTNPVTPNIGLNKIDRTSPSTTYFDLEKYIDQNADAVDRFAGESSEAIGALEKRLDTEERREVILQPGLQIVNAERSAPFKLSGIKGRTLVNLLGRDGDCEDVSKWPASAATVVLDTANKMFGSSSIKVTNSTAGTYGSAYRMTPEISNNRYYLVAGFVKLGVGSGAGLTFLNKNGANVFGNKISNTSSFELSYIRLSPSDIGTGATAARLKFDTGSNVANEYAYYDGIRIYEITQAQYAALGSMTPELIAAKYPYVDSVQPVRNPYAIRYGENLASGYSPAILHHSGLQSSTPTLISTYEVKFTGETISQNVDKGVYFDVPALPGQSYTAAVDTLADNAFIRFEYFKDSHSISNSKWVKNPDFFPSNAPATVSIPIDCSLIRVYITNQTSVYWNNGTLVNESLIGGNYHFKNWRLFLGPSDLGFKPREDSILALQTDLYADPLTGANADEVFKKDGQYFKLAKWKKVVLDTVAGDYYRTTEEPPGYKILGITGLATQAKGSTGSNDDYALLVKYNGIIIQNDDARMISTWNTELFRLAINTSGVLAVYVSIPNTESGWGDNYSPTVGEIKAYFMGWKMSISGGTRWENYNGTGTKVWIRITRLSDTIPLSNGIDYTTTLPTTPAGNDAQGNTYTPYQLVYQLATPIVEPIVCEGMMTFNEADNQIEVGTGMVVRESVKPVQSTTNKRWYLHASGISGGTSKPTNNLSKILNIYRENKNDGKWIKYVGTIVADFGLENAYCEGNHFDPSVAYSVTYLMLDKSPIVPFTGSYAVNEKAMLQEMTDAVQQNVTAVSVLMNKKTDKELSRGWIMPTLLNGWVTYYQTPGYLKDGEGFVHFKGRMASGVMTNETEIFRLPEGFRPSESRRVVVAVYVSGTAQTQSGTINIDPSGIVTIDQIPGNLYLSLDNTIFLAEK